MPGTAQGESTIAWWETFAPSIAAKLKAPPEAEEAPGQPAPATAPGDSAPGLPGPEETGQLNNISEKEIDETIGDPEKRLEALAKWKVPRFSDVYKSDTAESRFLDNLKTGVEKAQQYLNYIQNAADYLQKYGDFAGSDKIKAAG